MQTIRLTSVENFNRLLEVLKQHPFYAEEPNIPFLHSVGLIRHAIEDGEECYIESQYMTYEHQLCLVLRYFKRSEIPTDVEYTILNKKD